MRYANTRAQVGYVAHYKTLVQGVHAIWPKAQVILVVSIRALKPDRQHVLK